MAKDIKESSAIKGDNTQDFHNATGKDPALDRRDGMKDEVYKPTTIKFRRQLSEVLDASENLKLDIPKELLHPEYTYAWVAENRVTEKERLGWELVPDDHFGKNAGVSLRRPASKDSDNFLILMVTPKEWVTKREDRREQDRLVVEQGIATGKLDGKGDAMPENFKVLGDTRISNSMARKNQV